MPGPSPSGRGAYLLPAAPATAEILGPSRVRVLDFASGRVLEAEGVVGAEAIACLQGGEIGPFLKALAPSQLPDLLADPRAFPLTPESALRLEGFDTLFLELTLRCTARCVHCYASASPERTERLDRATCLQVLEDAAALGFPRVQLTGGDPLLCDFLDELLEAARARGLEAEVFTNGIGFDEAKMRSLAAHGASLAMTLYAADPAVHDAVTLVPGSHQRTCRAVESAVSHGVPVRVVSVATEANPGHARRALALAKRLGAEVPAHAAESRAVGRGGFVKAPAEGPEPAVGAAPAASCDGEPERQRGVLCVAGDGAVYPCVFNRQDRLGSVGQRRLRDLVAAPELGWLTPARPEAFLAEVGQRLQCRRCRCTAWGLRALARMTEAS